MSGWVLLIPFVVLGILLRTRWLAAISFAVVLLNSLILLSPGVQGAGPGTYLGWAAIAVAVLSGACLATMWLTAAVTGVVRTLVRRSQ